MEYYNKKEYIGHFGYDKWQKEVVSRKKQAVSVSLFTKDNDEFWYLLNPQILNQISYIEKQFGVLSANKLPVSFKNKITKTAKYYEAYYSSHIEGARTSLEEALLSLRSSKTEYNDESKQMIVNNKKGLDLLDEFVEKELNHEIIYKLHQELMQNTHKDEAILIGQYRQSPVYVVNSIGQIVYEAPEAKHVKTMMAELVNWVNANDETHPLIKAAIVHLYFVHIHPFADGNGRTARLLSGLVLMNHGYGFVNMISPSHYYDENRPRYYKAIRNVELHDYDLTYFIIFSLKAVINQLDLLDSEIKKSKKVVTIKDKLQKEKYQQLNKRQVKALNFMLKNSQGMATKKYCRINACSKESARKDFNQLIQLKLIYKQGQGRSQKYYLL